MLGMGKNIMDKEETFISNKQLLKQIKEIIEFQKEVLSGFYRENIGKIDKIKPVSREEYIVAQFNKPSGTSTVRLLKDKYILQKQNDDGSFSYIPFEKKRVPIIPNDEDTLKSLGNKYVKYSKLTKNQLINRVTSKYADILKDEKITKKQINSLSYQNLNTLFKSIGINELETALKYYRIKETTSVRVNRNISDYTDRNIYYDEYKNLTEEIKELNVQEILSKIMPLAKKIESEIEKYAKEISKNEFDRKTESKLLKISKNEILEKKIIPQNKQDLEFYFNEDYDFYKIKQDIYSGKLGMDIKTTFRFFRPCKNLSEVDDVFNSVEFASTQNYDSSLDYEEGEVLELK